MTSKEELESLGYVLSSSNKCIVFRWGKWHVLFKKFAGPHVAGYGDDEAKAFDDALKTARNVEENLKITP